MKNQVKYLQNLFYDLLKDYGKVLVVVKYSNRTIVGERGFTEEEKEKGIIVAFNRKNHRNLQWTKDGSIIAALGFGANNKPENCFLHCDDIVSIYSPDAKVIFERWDIESSPEESKTRKKLTKGKIISLDRFKEQKFKSR